VDGFEQVITDSRGHGLVVFCQKGESKKVEANARLIASAPLLLEAAEVARKMLLSMTSEDFSKGADRPARQALKAAIKAAKGE